MKKVLNRLTQYETLSEDESRNIIIEISEGKLNTSEIASFLTIFMIRNITIEELNGFRKALIELSLKINLDEYDLIDLCGTGGDEKDTFNISTLASFVTAGSGVKVAKHGNYGVSSSCGSSNVLESLGLNFNNNSNKIKEAVDKANICFLHAPLFHPAMKNVAPVRKELGLKTFFNMLGPMVNPTMPKKQIVGVYNLELARIYNYLYQQTDISYNVIHSLDGYDEISLTGDTKVYSRESEFILESKDFNLKNIKSDSIKGGIDIKSSSKIFMNVLNGNGTNDQEDVVCANASLAIAISKKEKACCANRANRVSRVAGAHEPCYTNQSRVLSYASKHS